MNTALTELPSQSIPVPPSNAVKESVTIHLTAGNSTIHYINMKV